MDPTRRAAFNAAFSPELYQRFFKLFESRLGHIPFTVAETPLFFTHALRDSLARQSSEIVAQLSAEPLLEKLRSAVPARYDVPGIDALPNCVQVDFALAQGTGSEAGQLVGKVVELQAFPSLYALMTYMSDAWAETIQNQPGLDADWSWAIDLPHSTALTLMRETIVAGEDPMEVVIVDLDPPSQKTSPDFEATRQLFGVEAVCVTQLIKDGRRLYRDRNGKRIQVKRIYNRMVFDELEVKKAIIPFAWNEPLDVSWCSHPNWYWIWSKYALPHLDHPAVPRARLLTELTEFPADLTRYVLKPLFSFAGAGVIVDLTPSDLAAIPQAERHNWILQEKIDYAEALHTPTGAGVKAEVRVMLIRPPQSTELIPLICLVRLSRGKMLGVDFNRGLDWVGGSVGMWER